MTDLARIIEAVEYEYWMFTTTGGVLSDGWSGLPMVERNAWIESHAIHLRNLLEFLFKTTDDRLIRASDDLFGANWHERWADADGMRALFERASEEIAHLSWGRFENPKTDWTQEKTDTVHGHFQRWLAMTSDEVQRLFADAQRRHSGLFILGGGPKGERAGFPSVNTMTINDRLFGRTDDK